MKPSTFNYERFLELQAENKELQAQLDERDEKIRKMHEAHAFWMTEEMGVQRQLIAQLAKYDEVAAEYGIDGKTMLTLAKSQIRTAKSNVELQEQLVDSQRRAQTARNELCLKCGRYREAHNGACDGCRWKEI